MLLGEQARKSALLDQRLPAPAYVPVTAQAMSRQPAAPTPDASGGQEFTYVSYEHTYDIFGCH